jgi:hypothetical protein
MMNDFNNFFSNEFVKTFRIKNSDPFLYYQTIPKILLPLNSILILINL